MRITHPRTPAPVIQRTPGAARGTKDLQWLFGIPIPQHFQIAGDTPAILPNNVSPWFFHTNRGFLRTRRLPGDPSCMCVSASAI